MTRFTGSRIDNGKTVTGDYCRCEMDGCWIGSSDRSGHWKTKVDPGSVREIRNEQSD